MSRVVDMGNPDRRRLIAFGLIAVALLLALGCTRVDEVTPPPPPEIFTAVTDTPFPTPTPTPDIDYRQCEVGLRLNPGEGCFYNDQGWADFTLAVQPDGIAVLDGDIGPMSVSNRRAEPGEKLCPCDLHTEPRGQSRVVTALPYPMTIRRYDRLAVPPSPFLGECLVGMEVETGELCVYPGSVCAFEVTVDGVGNFLAMSDAERIEANDVINGELTYNFLAEGSEKVWTIQSVPPPRRDDFMGERVDCPPDEQVAGLADAIWRHDIAQAQRLIDSGANVNALQQYGWRLLEVAVRYSDDYESAKMVERLIAAGADVNAISAHGDPILRSAARDETINALKLLLDAGADPNARDGLGGPILDTAIGNEAEDAVRLLVEVGADIDAQDYKGAPMLLAPLIFGKSDIIRVLADLGADVHAVDRSGRPLLFTAYGEGAEMMQLMLDAGADANARSWYGSPILSSIAESEHPDLVRLLLDAGADPDACDSRGGVPLFYAIRSGQVGNVQALVESGANVNVFDGEGDPLLVRALRRGIDSIVRIFVNAGADVNAIDSDGMTMLEHARQIGSQPAVQYLIDSGAE